MVIFCFLLAGSYAATVTGSLQDITIQPLNTVLMFAPTNDVLLTGTGLNAGPPKSIETINGQFSIVLEAGDYTLSLPLVPWRHSFVISVPNTNGTLNITNLLAAPRSYTYTNNLNFAVKATATDASPDVLETKLNVAGSLSKTLATNAGSVSITLSNPGPMHVNGAQKMCWSTNGETSLLDGALTLPAGSLSAGSILRIEAFGSFADPGGNSPTATVRLKLGGTTVVTQSKAVGAANWHLSALATVRSSGSSGSVCGALALGLDDNTAFPMATQTATVNTTGSLAVDLTGTIDDVTQAENLICEQLVVSLE